MKMIFDSEAGGVSVVVKLQTHAVVNFVVLQCHVILIYCVPLLNSVSSMENVI